MTTVVNNPYTTVDVPGQTFGPGQPAATVSVPGQTFGPGFTTSVSVPGELFGPRQQPTVTNPYGSFLPFAPAGLTNDVAPRIPAEIKDVTVAAGGPVSTTYGRARIVGQLYMHVTDVFFLGIYVFGRGEFEQFEKLSIDGREVDVSARGSSEFTDSTLTGPNGYCQLFLGTSGQDVSNATASGRTSEWITETLANTVCVVVQIDGRDHEISGRFPRVEAIVQGRNDIFDPRSGGSTGYSANAVLCLNHFLTTYFDSSTSGDTATLSDVADRCDGIGSGNTLSGGGPRHTWGMTIGERNVAIEKLSATLESAARVYATEEDGTWYYIPAGPKSFAHSFDESRILPGAEMKGQDPKEFVTDVRVRFSDVDNNTVGVAEAVGGTSGKVSEITLSHITTHEEAKRAAIERYNHLRNEDELIDLTVFAEGLKVLRGEVIRVTHAGLGLSNDEFTVTRAVMGKPGQWRLFCREYRSSTWSDSVVSDPISTIGDPDSDALNPPTVASLSGTATATGRLARLDLTWTDPGYAYYRQVRVDVYDEDEDPDVLLGTYFTRDRDSISISGVPADVNFRVDVRVLSTAGIEGSIATDSVAKPVLPTPPAVTSASIVPVQPVNIGEADGMRLRVRWNDVDYRAWIGYRLKVWVAQVGTVPDFEFTLPQGGEGTVDVTGPGPGSAVYGNIQSYFFRLVAFNAAGDESAEYIIQSQDMFFGGLNAEHVLSQVEDLEVVGTARATWWDDGDDGNGNHRVRLALQNLPQQAAGFWLNVYECNSGGVISAPHARFFFSAGAIGAQVHADTWSEDYSYGLQSFDTAAFTTVTHRPTTSEQHLFFYVEDTPGARYYRYRLQYVGLGEQFYPEFDVEEDNTGNLGVSPSGSTVHGPI